MYMIVQVWLCDLCYTQQIVSAEVMPAAVGGIATFCESHIEHAPEVRLFKYPEKLIEAIKEGVPHIIGFSNYCWNFELSYGFAQLFKRKYPDTVVVMGGPNYPIDMLNQELFMREHPAIDFYISKEGELPFSRLVEALRAHNFDVDAVKNLELGSTHGITKKGRFVAAPILGRLQDLTTIPSPYLIGKMDEFFDGVLMPILQACRGCPFTCTYCTEGNPYFNKVHWNSGKKIAVEIDYIGRKMAESCASGGRNDLFIADSNFGMFRQDLETCRQIARAQELYNWPEYVIVGTGKNKKKRVLEAAHLINGRLRLAGSVQSLDPEILVNIKRNNVDVQQLIDLATEAKEVGANSYAEVILALPGDSVEKHFQTIRTLIDAGFTDVYMFQLMLLNGSEMFTPEVRKQYKMGTQYRVIPRCFGNYSVDGESIVTAEIEEIATSLSTLTFEDYLYCRRFNLIVTVFYNDAVFQGLLKLLQHLEISRYTWIETVFKHEFTGGLGRAIDNFVRETKEELWDSRDDLVAFTRKPGNVEKYINDELGANLIFKYQSLLSNQNLREITEVARLSILKVIAEKDKLTPEIEAFVDDILTYEVLRKIDIFKGDYSPHYAELYYDVEKFLAATDDAPLSEFVFSKPQKYCFFLDKEQIGIIERSFNTYGRTPVGMARILARVHVKMLLRRTHMEP
jgi:radical SAM superfamily enzyme YgiQ (UPF0313 family)